MKKIIAVLLLASFVCSFAPELLAAKVVSKRPVFPIGGKKVVKPAPVKPVGRAVEMGSPVPVVPVAKPPLRSGWLAEGGLGGGALLLEGVYQKGFSDKLAARFGVGYGLGGKFGVVVVEGGACYDLGAFQVGAGLNYAAYSDLVSGVPGISGIISSKNLLGLELFGMTRINDKFNARLGYSTSLGLRASVSYEL